MNAQMKRGNLDLCVLALLAKGDMYGYELADRLSGLIDVAGGTIYPLMKRIRDEGLVTTYLRESPEGPPRKYYAITGAGLIKKNLMEREWREFTAAMDKILGV